MVDGSSYGDGQGDSQPMSPEQFTSYMARRLSLFEDQVEVLSWVELELRLRIGDRSVLADLEAFYAAYTANPAQIDTIARNFIQSLLGAVPDRSEQEFTALAERVMPMLKPASLLLTVRESNLPMLAYRPFLADLIIAYVIDEGQSVTYMNEEHLDRWRISEQELHELALENLRQRTHERVRYTVAGEGERSLFIFNSGDGYDATRILLSDVLASWARQIPETLVIGIPNRDFLIAFSDADDEILRSIAHQIQADSARFEHGLTDQLFTFAAGRITEYDWK